MGKPCLMSGHKVFHFFLWTIHFTPNNIYNGVRNQSSSIRGRKKREKTEEVRDGKREKMKNEKGKGKRTS